MAELSRFWEFSFTLPSIDCVARNAKTLCNLLYGEICFVLFGHRVQQTRWVVAVLKILSDPLPRQERQPEKKDLCIFVSVLTNLPKCCDFITTRQGAHP